MTPTYDIAKFLIEDIRGETWYFPKHKKEFGVAKSLLSPGKDPEGNPIPSFTAEQVKTVLLALRNGCHLTGYRPIQESDLAWMADSKGPKGLWVVRDLIYDFFYHPPDPPPFWQQPEYDMWVRTFGPTSFSQGNLLFYSGWTQLGPEESGIPASELEDMFGSAFVNVSIKMWEYVYRRTTTS